MHMPYATDDQRFTRQPSALWESETVQSALFRHANAALFTREERPGPRPWLC
jgi:hypothetical protein